VRPIKVKKKRRDRQIDGWTDDRYITLTAGRGQRNNPLIKGWLFIFIHRDGRNTTTRKLIQKLNEKRKELDETNPTQNKWEHSNNSFIHSFILFSNKGPKGP